MADRDKSGRFAKGNQVGVGSGGRPRRSVEERYLKALSRTVSMADWKTITIKAIEQAKEGDKAARQWLSDYLIGKPTQYVNADLTTAGDKFDMRTIIIYESDGDDGT